MGHRPGLNGTLTSKKALTCASSSQSCMFCWGIRFCLEVKSLYKWAQAVQCDLYQHRNQSISSSVQCKSLRHNPVDTMDSELLKDTSQWAQGRPHWERWMNGDKRFLSPKHLACLQGFVCLLAHLILTVRLWNNHQILEYLFTDEGTNTQVYGAVKPMPSYLSSPITSLNKMPQCLSYQKEKRKEKEDRMGDQSSGSQATWSQVKAGTTESAHRSWMCGACL